MIKEISKQLVIIGIVIVVYNLPNMYTLYRIESKLDKLLQQNSIINDEIYKL